MRVAWGGLIDIPACNELLYILKSKPPVLTNSKLLQHDLLNPSGNFFSISSIIYHSRPKLAANHRTLAPAFPQIMNDHNITPPIFQAALPAATAVPPAVPPAVPSFGSASLPLPLLDPLQHSSPMAFVESYSTLHNLPSVSVQSPLELACHTRACAARDEYKNLVRQGSPSTQHTPSLSLPSSSSSAHTSSSSHALHTTQISTPDHVIAPCRSLSKAQKHAVRLRNNRRSARAAKVYREIFHREISALLQRLSVSYARECACSDAKKNNNLHISREVELLQLQNKVAKLIAQRDWLTQKLHDINAKHSAAVMESPRDGNNSHGLRASVTSDINSKTSRD